MALETDVRERVDYFLAVAFFAAGFLAVAFFAAGFLAVTFFAAGFLAVVFFAAGFLAVAFFAAGFLAVAFFVVAFFALVFFAGAGLGEAFTSTMFKSIVGVLGESVGMGGVWVVAGARDGASY